MRGDVTFNPGNWYHVGATDAREGFGSHNYITDEAKWLYYQFGNDLSQLDKGNESPFTAASLQDGYDLQQAIWHGVLLADQGGGYYGPGSLNTSFDLVAQALYADAVTALTGANAAIAQAEADEVRVLSPMDANGNYAQAQLYIPVAFKDLNVTIGKASSNPSVGVD